MTDAASIAVLIIFLSVFTETHLAPFDILFI